MFRAWPMYGRHRPRDCVGTISVGVCDVGDAMEGPSDEALLAGMANGDRDAAVAFVRRYQARAFGLALAVVGDRQLAEDVAQEAFVRVWRHAQVFEATRGTARAWVATIVRNLAIDALRLRREAPADLSGLLAAVATT